jgi:membrane associated rhomboid family serine protease
MLTTKYPATMFILTVCIAVMIVASIVPGAAHVLAFRPEDGWYGWLGLLTHMFDHGGWRHLAANLTFGIPSLAYLESRVGRRKTLALYLTCGVIGALADSVVFEFASRLGASVSLYGCVAAAAMLFGETVAEQVASVVFLLVLIVPQILLIPKELILEVMFVGHVAGALTGLTMAHRLINKKEKKENTDA